MASVKSGLRRMRRWAGGWRSKRRLDASTAVPAAARPGILASGVDVARSGTVYVDTRWTPGGVTSQFAADAATYHARYFDRLDFDNLVDRCLRLAAIDRTGEARVLDIGSGGGSSVFALCRLLPRAEIVASDISPELLDMLATFAESRDDLRGRIQPFCFDLHRRFFRAETFDLVVGAAILHHLLDPAAALVNVARALKRGGRIVLVEPLESGSLVLASMYAEVLRVLISLGQGEGRLAQLMTALRRDIHARTGPPHVKPWTAELDDKWLFDEPYLAALAKDIGMSRVEVHPAQDDLAHVFEEAFRSVLADSGNAGLDIPHAVNDCVRAFDAGIDAALKRRLCPTGVVVFVK